MNLIESIVNDGHGALNPQYLFIHETANPGATAKNHRDLYSRGYDYAVHYVSDWTGDVYHCMYDNRLAWAVGNGNPYGVSLEICHATNAADFKKTWDTAVEFAAFYLNKRGWGISKLMSHDECRIKWGGTDHTDPIGYFKEYGKTWDDFKNAVSKAMKGTIETTGDEVVPITNTGGKIYRYYNTKTGEHFPCTEAEGNTLKAPWKKEGLAFTAPKGGILPVWRFINKNGFHMFTANYKEAVDLQKAGWKLESVPFFAKTSGTPVYRVYNKVNGDHLFTTDKAEVDALVKLGWKDEKVAFYV